MKSERRWRYSTLLSTALASVLLLTPVTKAQAQTESETANNEPAVTEVQETPADQVTEESGAEKNETAEEASEASTESEETSQAEDTQEKEEKEESLPEESSQTEKEEKTTPKAPNVQFDEKTFYMTNQNTVQIKAYIGDANPADFTWTFNGKPVETLQQWNYLTGQFDNDRRFIKMSDPVVKNGIMTMTFHFDYPFTDRFQPEGAANLDQRYDEGGNLRLTYPKYIGRYNLVGTHTNGQTITQTINYRPYKYFLDYDEMVKKTDEITAKAQEKGEHYVTIKKYGESVEGRPLRYGIVADSEKSVNRYLNEIHPKMLNNPRELINMIKNNPNADYRIPVFIHNTHADENPGPEVVAGMYKKLALENTIALKTKDENGKEKQVTLNVPDMLNRLIFLFTFVESPDSRAHNFREHPSTGLDLNRDHGYQVLPEVKAMTKVINEWDPLAFFDIHGFVNPLLIEPTNPPHDPNFEADLIYPNALKQAYAIGRAAETNAGYKFQIPFENWRKFNENPDNPALKGTENVGWDDAFSGYTGVYALYHGIFGHTVEIPEMNDRSYIAGVTGILGALHNMMGNIDELVISKLQIFDRGINKVEAPETEDYFVGADNKPKGRPRKEGQNFFPDYYIIPMNVNTQKNTQAAFEMIEYFRRNGVKVNQLTQDMGGFHKGDLIINMAQAKRGYANHILYQGSNESEFPAMYAELIANFPALRGFDSHAIYNEEGKDLFANVMGEVTHKQAPQNNPGLAPYYFVKNNGAHVIKAVNEAINNGHKVYLADNGYYMDKATYDLLASKYALIAKGEQKRPTGQAIKPLKIYAQLAASYDDRYPSNGKLALAEMGFQLVDSIEEADLIVLSEYVEKDMLGKKPAIILGGWAGMDLAEHLPGLKVQRGHEWMSYEGLMKAQFDQNNPLTSGFNAEDLFYSRDASWIAELPEGFKALVQIQNSDDFYVAGWWPGHEAVKGQVMAIVGEYGGQPIFYYAGTPVNKMHTKNFYRIVANAIFSEIGAVKASDLADLAPEVVKPEQTAQKQVAAAQTSVDKTVANLPSTGTEDNTALLLTALGLLGTGFVLVNRKKEHTA